MKHQSNCRFPISRNYRSVLSPWRNYHKHAPSGNRGLCKDSTKTIKLTKSLIENVNSTQRELTKYGPKVSTLCTLDLLKKSLSTPAISLDVGKALNHVTIEGQVKNKYIEGKYRKLIEIISDPAILKDSYERIKSKPGNLSPGEDPGKETLDGINKK